MPVPTLLNYKKKDLWPQTSLDLVIDPKTGKPVDLSKFVTVNDAAGRTYTVNGNQADDNGNFVVTAEGIGAAAADHTHTLNSLGAAAANHGHEISDINGLEARLLGLDIGGSTVEGGFAMEPLNNNTYPEPSAWQNPYDEPGE